MSKQNKKVKIQTLALGAMFTALVILLQMVGQFIRFGTFQTSLVLVPIIIGAALCGSKMGAWLGFVFGMVVLLNGDALLFLNWNIVGTIVTVLLKGTLCGFIAGLVYNLIEKHNKHIAAFATAVVCPIVNTGVFVLGCYAFFYNDIAKFAIENGMGNVTSAIFIGFAGGNFIFELILNLVLTPVIIIVLKSVKSLRV